MLSIREVRLNFYQFDLFSKLGLFPLEFDVKTGEVKPSPKRWKQLLSLNGHFVMLNLFCLFLVGRFIQAMVFPNEYLVLRDLSLHVMWVVWIVGDVWFAAASFILWPDIMAGILNELYFDSNDVRAGRSWKTFSLLEWYTALHPGLMVNLMVCALGYFLLDPNKLFFWHSLVPVEYRSGWTLALFFLVQVYCMVLSLYAFMLVDFAMISFFQKVHYLVDTECGTIWKNQTGLRGLHEATQLCRRLQLLIQMFNQVFAFITFGFKFACITSAISGLYFGITLLHLNEFPLEAVVLIVFGVNQLIIFVFVFDRAFQIPVLIGALKAQIRVRAGSANIEMRGVNFIWKVLDAVPSVGIKVGTFHTFERASTPNFVNFVTSHLLGLLIMFKFGK